MDDQSDFFRCQSGAIATPALSPHDLVLALAIEAWQLCSSVASSVSLTPPSGDYNIDYFVQVRVLSVIQSERPSIESHYTLAAGSFL